jgi:IS5 family transposase
MLRIYFVQQWVQSLRSQAEDALYDSESIRRFVGVKLGDDVVPDETTILRFRHLLERHQLTAAIFATIRELLTEKRLLLKAGTIVGGNSSAGFTRFCYSPWGALNSASKGFTSMYARLYLNSTGYSN